MREFFDQAFSMPTTVFSVLLIAAGCYWLLKLVTGLDVFDGLLEGAEATLEGGIEGGLEAGADTVDVGEGGHGRGWVRLLGFGEVPVMLVISMIALFGWAFSFGGSRLAPRLAIFAAGGIGAVLAIGAGAMALALGATMVAMTPLRRMMRFAPATANRQLVGRTARVTTLRVDERFGQAEVEDLSGAPILVQARASGPNDLTRGSLVTLTSYDSAQEVFTVDALSSRGDV